MLEVWVAIGIFALTTGGGWLIGIHKLSVKIGTNLQIIEGLETRVKKLEKAVETFVPRESIEAKIESKYKHGIDKLGYVEKNVDRLEQRIDGMVQKKYVNIRKDGRDD